MNHKEYMAQVIDEDGEEFNMKTFAITMQEALDNIVLLCRDWWKVDKERQSKSKWFEGSKKFNYRRKRISRGTN